MGIALCVIGSLIGAGSLGYLSYYFIKLLIGRQIEAYKPTKQDYLYFLLLPLATAIGIYTIVRGSYFVTNQNLAITGELLIGFGSVITVYLLLNFFISFIMYYYKKNLCPKFKRACGWSYWLSFILFWVALFWIWLEGAAPYITYPLINGVGINGSGIHWNTYISGHDGFNIQFYALCILAGAVFVYFLCDHKLYKKYGEHGLLESTFFIAFPAGIIGARIWYVVGEWSTKFAPVFAEDPWKMFRIWDGGLTIMGGAFFGIVVGVLWVLLTKKKFKLLDTIDFIVPTILLAQAIGRWGNFFNHEVYGQTQLLIENVWYLPSFIKNQMAVSFSSGMPGAYMYTPLFLIEGICNVAGYFALVYGFGEHKLVMKGIAAISNRVSGGKLKEETKNKIVNAIPLGAIAGLYLVYYGAVRFILEPLRDPSFNMGENGQWSNIQSLIYIGIGLAVVGLFALYQYVVGPKIKEKLKNRKPKVTKGNDSLND
ncbi:MAG: prolipoprotein diacylglyceryl transferase [Bacilli bacterium]